MIDMNALRQFGDPSSENVLIQLGDGHDMDLMEREAAAVRELSGGTDWSILAVPVIDWNGDLTPWPAGPVFGKQGFGAGAPATLRELLACPMPGRRRFLCGYSLAGLFALWAVYQTDFFAGTAAVSPSVWYPGWLGYVEEHRVLTPAVYLSLGDREEKTKNPTMAAVGGAIRRQHALLSSAGVRTVLEWNPGNHFVDSEKRLAKGIAWLFRNAGG